MDTGYSFSQQQKDFIKLQFKFALKLKQKLDAGEISQDYYDQNIWLAQQQLQDPYPGFWGDFEQAVVDAGAGLDSGLQWLSKQTGESVQDLASYMGGLVGKAAGGLIGGAAKGVATSLGTAGWILILLLIVVLIWAFAKGPLSEVKVKSV